MTTELKTTQTIKHYNKQVTVQVSLSGILPLPVNLCTNSLSLPLFHTSVYHNVSVLAPSVKWVKISGLQIQMQHQTTHVSIPGIKTGLSQFKQFMFCLCRCKHCEQFVRKTD